MTLSISRVHSLFVLAALAGLTGAQSSEQQAAQAPAVPRGARPANPSSNADPGKTYAILVGISRYLHDPPVASLQFADKDAETLAEFLQKPRGGGLRIPDQIKLLTNERATRAAIDDAVQEFAAAGAGAGDTLILFVAGHGVYLKTEEDPVTHQKIDREPYILTYESNPQDPKTTGYAMDEFRQMIFRQAAHLRRVLVFLDVCHAGNVTGIAGGSDLEEPVRRVFEGRVGDLGMLLASEARKVAYESEAFGGGHGAFSYFVIKGMNGSAALDRNRSISFGDLAVYVSYNVERFTRGKQVPDRWASDNSLPVVYDTALEGITLGDPQPLGDEELKREARRSRKVPRAGQTSGRELPVDPFDRAISRGLLLPEDTGSAWNMLSQFQADPTLHDRQRRLRVALEDRGQELVSRYLEGEQAPQQKSAFDLCARYFDQALLLSPDAGFDRSRSLFCKGRSLIFEARYDEAESLLNDSVQADPKRAYAYNALGIAHLESVVRTGRGFDEGRQALLSAIRYAPYWAYPLHNLALLESERGNYQEAIRLYERAMSVAPRYSYLPYNLGLLYQRLGDLDSARRWLERAREIQEASPPRGSGAWPERAEIWNALGTLFREQGRDRKAIEQFEKALVDDPDNENAKQNLGSLRYKRGQIDMAEQLWLANISHSSSFLPSRISYADSLERRGQTAAAIEQYQAVLFQKPDFISAHQALARLYLGQGRYEQALEHARESLEASRPPAMVELLGDIYERLGRFDDAVETWKQALDASAVRPVRSRLEAKIRKLRGVKR